MLSVSLHTKLSQSALLLIAFLLLPCSTTAATSDTTTVDFTKSPSRSVAGSCGVLNLTGIKDGESYSLYVRGTTSGTCSFQAKGLTFHYPSNWGATTTGTSTIFWFQRFGTDVVVGWSTGY